MADSRMDEYIGRLPSLELAAAVCERIERWGNNMSSNGLLSQMRQNYRLYYNVDPYAVNNSYWNNFGLAGEHGEYLNIRINHFRNLLTNMLNMIFSKLPVMKSRAGNTSPDALNSVSLFDSILEFTFHSKRINRHCKKAGEMGLLFGTGACLVEWDFMAGDPYVPDQMGNMITNGDIRVRSKSPLDWYTDTFKEEWDDVDWVIVRDYCNKYQLAAQFPDLADKILDVDPKDYNQNLFFFDPNESDDLPVYKFFHKPINGLMPDGRYAIILSSDIILHDGPNPYNCIPLFLIKPSEGMGSFYGYSVSNDLAPMQVFYNMVMSAIATNVSAHAVPNILIPSGSNITVSQIQGGMNVIDYEATFGKPEALNLLQTSPEVYQLSQMINQLMETISGVNSVARGQPNDNLKSGVALGIVQSMAVQFMSGFQQSVINFLEDMGNYILKMYKTFAETPRLVTIAGKDKINEIRNWTKQDISAVASIYIDPIDPVSQTIAGRMAIADNLIQHGNVNAQEYITVATTGQLEPMYKGQTSELNLIRTENQKMLMGEQVPVIFTDDHQLHIMEHKVVLADPDIRTDSGIVQLVLEHIQEHMNILNPPPPMIGPPGLPQPEMQNQQPTEQAMPQQLLQTQQPQMGGVQ